MAPNIFQTTSKHSLYIMSTSGIRLSFLPTNVNTQRIQIYHEPIIVYPNQRRYGMELETPYVLNLLCVLNKKSN